MGWISGWQWWVADHFGGKRPLVEHVVQQGRYRLGLLRSFSSVTWSAVGRLVFVCHGNICRSPYAEVVARDRCGAEAASFGLRAKTGVGANEAAIRNAALRRVDLVAHRATASDDFVLRDNDLLIAMEPRQATALRLFAQQSATTVQVTLLGLWAAPLRPYIADPYGLCDAYFQNCFALIETGVERMVGLCSAFDIQSQPESRARNEVSS